MGTPGYGRALINGMENKICGKCGTSERYKSGECKKCRGDRKKKYRAIERGDYLPNAVPVANAVGTVQVSSTGALVVDVPIDKSAPDINLANELSSSKRRLNFMVTRHEQTLNDINREMARLDQCLREAVMATDQRFYTSERRKLLESRMGHDQRLSKEIAAFQEMVAKDDNETPVTFVHVGLPPREWVTVPCVGDTMDFSDYMPERMGDAPPVKK